jgi:hypothetical protein
MPSQAAKNVSQIAIKYATAGARGYGSSTDNDLVEFVADHIDITADLLSELGTGTSKAQVISLLALKLGTMGNFLTNKYAKCGVGLGSLAIGLGAAGVQVVGGVTIPMGIATATSVLSEFYAVANDCAVPAAEVSKKLKVIKNNTENTWRWANTPSGLISIMHYLR